MSVLPLESNPDVMTQFLHKLGVSEKWNVVDVFGLDEQCLAWVPRPVLGLILLYPCNEKASEYANEECKKLKDVGQHIDPEIFHMRQYVRNACGTFALIHCVANNTDKIEIKDGAFKKILNDAKGLTPHERGELLLKLNDETMAFLNTHEEFAKQGQTEVNPNEAVNHHFIALIEKNGNLFELDGNKEFPINHGPTSTDTFLEDAAKVCKKFMERDSEDMKFTVMALAAVDN